MMDPPALEARLERIERALGDLSQRVNALESSSPPDAPSPLASSQGPDTDEAALAPDPRLGAGIGDQLAGLPALIGRTCLVLGGAFLVRSLADSGVLPIGVGFGIGIAYALVWLFLADRAASKGNAVGGGFHAMASALIVYPLLFEASTRFSLLTPWSAALALLAATGLGLSVAWRRAFHAAAWITVTAALAVVVMGLIRTHEPLPFVTALLVLATASLVLAYGRGWRGQRWLVAVSVDIVVFVLGLLYFDKPAPAWLPIGVVLMAQIGLVVIYLGSFTLRLLGQGRLVTSFAITQTIAALAIGFEGALLVGSPRTRALLAIAAIVTGVLLHGVLARRSERKWGHGMAVGYFSTVATFLAAEAARVLLPPAIYPILWLLASVVIAVLASSGERPILQVQAALLSLAGAASVGLLRASFSALARGAKGAWPEFSVSSLLVLSLVSITAVLLYRPRDGRGRFSSWARRGVLLVALVGLCGLLVRGASGAFAGAPGADADAAIVAVIRSAVLVIAALGLAASALAFRRRELLRLATFVLILGGLKLVIEDLRVGHAGHLVFSLALYGVALIVVPMLARRGRAADAAKQ